MYAIGWLELKRRVAIELWRTERRDEVLLSSKQLARFGNWLTSLPEHVQGEFIDALTERVIREQGECALLGSQLLMLGEHLMSEHLKRILKNWDVKEAAALLELAPTALPLRYRQCKIEATFESDGTWVLEFDPSEKRQPTEARDWFDLVTVAQEALSGLEIGAAA